MTELATDCQTLFEELARARSEHFTGRLDLQPLANKATADDGAIVWQLYFCLGRLYWAKDDRHPRRRLYRLLSKYAPSLDLKQLSVRREDDLDCLGYRLLTILMQRKVLDRERFSQLVEQAMAEIFFEIVQQTGGQGLRADRHPQDVLDILKTSSTLVRVDRAQQQAEAAWQVWKAAGLADRSPARAPLIRQPEVLRQKTNPDVYAKLARTINGKHTLYELAALMGKDPPILARSLLPYFQRGILELRPVEDIPPFVTVRGGGGREGGRNGTPAASGPAERSRGGRAAPTAAASAEPAPARAAKTPAAKLPEIVLPDGRTPTVACVDDSPQVRAVMGRLLKAMGCRFLGIGDSTRALPLLLQHKPDFIFLDLVMPVANGYEICTQIRRIATFKETPVVILTGNDGIIDRVRAKVVGANDFLGKPVEVEKIASVLHKYLAEGASSSPEESPSVSMVSPLSPESQSHSPA